VAKFESHITFNVKDAEKVKLMGEWYNWKYSQIEGDALLGPKPYCYLTSYEPVLSDLKFRMDKIVEDAKIRAVDVLRTKIERIVWDTKTGVDELSPAKDYLPFSGVGWGV